MLLGATDGSLAAEKAAAPRFKVRSVTGKTLDLEVLRRSGPVLIDFWATWCKPCLASLPELEALHRKHGPQGLTVLGVSIDGPRNYSKVRPFATRIGLTYPLVLDHDGELQQKYQVRAIPTSVLVDRSGAIVLVQQGYRPGEMAELEAAVGALLADGAPGMGADSSLAPTKP